MSVREKLVTQTKHVIQNLKKHWLIMAVVTSPTTSFPTTLPSHEPTNLPSFVRLSSTDSGIQSCDNRDHSQSHLNHTKIDLQFDYELVFHNNVNDTDTTLAVKELEDRILNDLARQFLKCQSESGRMRMLQTNVNDTMLASESESESESESASDVDISDDRNSTGIVQLESRPVDLPDADLGKFELFV